MPHACSKHWQVEGCRQQHLSHHCWGLRRSWGQRLPVASVEIAARMAAPGSGAARMASLAARLRCRGSASPSTTCHSMSLALCSITMHGVWGGPQAAGHRLPARLTLCHPLLLDPRQADVGEHLLPGQPAIHQAPDLQRQHEWGVDGGAAGCQTCSPSGHLVRVRPCPHPVSTSR